MKATRLIPKTNDAFKFLNYVVSRSDSDFLKPQIVCENGKLTSIVLLKNGYIVYDLSQKFEVEGKDFVVSIVNDKYFKVFDELKNGEILVSDGKIIVRGQNYEYTISVEKADEKTKIGFEDFDTGILISDLKKYTKYLNLLDYKKVFYPGLQNFYFFGDKVVFTNGYVMIVLPSEINANLVVPFEIKNYIYDEDVLCRGFEDSKLAFKGKDFYGVINCEVNKKISEIYERFSRMEYSYHTFALPDLPAFKRNEDVFLGIMKDGVFVCEGLDYDYRFRIANLTLQDDVYFSTELNQILKHLSGESVIFGVDYFAKTCLISKEGMTVYSVLRKKT